MRSCTSPRSAAGGRFRDVAFLVRWCAEAPSAEHRSDSFLDARALSAADGTSLTSYLGVAPICVRWRPCAARTMRCAGFLGRLRGPRLVALGPGRGRARGSSSGRARVTSAEVASAASIVAWIAFSRCSRAAPGCCPVAPRPPSAMRSSAARSSACAADEGMARAAHEGAGFGLGRGAGPIGRARAAAV